MVKEYFIDKISNINIQGSVISVDLARVLPPEGGSETPKVDKRLTLTLTGANFISLVNSLNQTVKAISERQNNNMSAKDKDRSPVKKSK
jgi:hypothetical protein